MKPDWKDAPEWANYLAMDSSGSWYWYELKPCCVIDGVQGYWGEIYGRNKIYGKFKWENSLQEKPE